MKTHLTKRNCPVCLEPSKNSRITVQSKLRAETLDFNEIADYFVGIRHEQVFFSYHRCMSCGVLYCPTYLSEDSVKKLYENMPDNTSVAGARGTEKTQRAYSRLFSDRPGAKSLLDIGSDIGLLGENLLARDYNHVTCVEPNSAVWGDIRRRLAKSVTITSDLSEVSPDQRFSAVAAIHLVDHVLEPRRLVEEILARTELNGELLVVVHNEQSTLRHLMGPKWPPFCLQHPQIFNRKTLRRLLESVGWQVESMGATTNYVSVSVAASHLASVVMGKFAPSFPAFESVVPVRTGNFYGLFKPSPWPQGVQVSRGRS